MTFPGSPRRRRLLLPAALLLGAVSLAGFLRPGLMPDSVHGFVTGVASVLAAAWLCFRLMPSWWRQQCEEDNAAPVARRYRREMFPAMALYVLLVLGSSWWLNRGIESLALRAVVAILPVLPIAWVMRAFLNYLRGVDEFKRQIELESIAVGALVVSMAYMAGAFLQLAKVIDVPAGAAMVWVFPLICLGYGVGKFLAMRRYR